MTEKEFIYFCKINNISHKFINTHNCFCNSSDIIGCNKSGKNYIIYNTNALGQVYKICTFKSEHYAYMFLQAMTKNYLELEYGKNKVKGLKK